MLKPNDIIPTDITVLDEENQKVTLKEYLGQLLVIYFYPKDNTAGCTIEAQQFRNHYHTFTKAKVKVLGISKDSVESHRNFKQKLDLNFELLSDPEHKLQEAFGVWQEKRMMGKKYMGTARSTFLIDKKGNVLKVWSKVKPAEHVQEVIEFLGKMRK